MEKSALNSDDDAIEAVVDEHVLSPEEQAASKKQRRAAALRISDTSSESDYSGSGPSQPAATRPSSPGDEISPIGSPMANDSLLTRNPGTAMAQEDSTTAPAAAYLSLGTVLQGKKDYKLQSVEPFFTDPT